ncbi:hypothetical protein AK830_g3213 [Neonectria ditissima]|uniref:Carboxylesterase family protein n=1 Tax=Neonectria ditissima TaxID=78410 RepID=A0A0P7BPP7_9HYPO|nr:hypothetical protein AK830_g3213 [Neonectria ditissima]
MARVNRATNSVPAATTSIPSIRQHSTINTLPESKWNAEATSKIPSSISRGLLQELSISQVQNTPIAPLAPQSHDDPGLKPSSYTIHTTGINVNANAKHSSRGLRRRGPIDSAVFEPLDAVLEESVIAPTSITAVACAAAPTEAAPANAVRLVADPHSPQATASDIHPLLLAADPDCSNRQQIEKHLAGQFEWLLSCPAPASSAKDQRFFTSDDDRRKRGTVVFGCNLLSRKRRSPSRKTTTACPLANTYTLIATPLEGDAYSLPDLHLSQALANKVNMALAQTSPYDCHQDTPLKVPEVEVNEVVEQAVSPSLTLISDRSSSYAGGSSRAGSFSVPRIEDSLEELDKLEEELEAINAVTQPRRITAPDDVKPSPKHLEPRPDAKKPSVSKRASMSSLSATVRVKQSERAQPSIRRSTSLVFRNKKEETKEQPKLRSQLSRSKLANAQPPTPKAPIKSTKPPTVPNFELPGEAVARRLREQREARLAQQAESQKAYVAPPRPRSNKPLTKPNFELPGEAISRRKREEREARLKAQEEEERKKREFKARPMRPSVVPSTVPRETITSRARQGKSLNDDARKPLDSTKSQRESLGAKSAHARGRLSNMTSQEDLSRGTSSTGSSGGKRNTLSAEEAQQLKLKGKQIFQRDNTGFTRDKEREKRDREAAARLAREQAAERSRAAGREWAEKKRRKDLALRESMRQMT